MSGRRWAEGKPDGERGGPRQRPRPSERGTDATPSSGGKGSSTPGKKPSADAMRRARARLSPPKAPWHPLPLSEASIVLGLLAMVVSRFSKNTLGFVAGLLLLTLGTAEVSWREHRHGYRSHGALLAALFALPVALGLWRVAHAPRNISMFVGLAIFLLGWSAFTRSYRVARERADR